MNTSGPGLQPLEGINVTIDCPLRFGRLREEWNVEWTVRDRHDITNSFPRSGYFFQSSPKFQLVIKNASIDYEGARFQCRGILPVGSQSVSDRSQVVQLNLFRK